MSADPFCSMPPTMTSSPRSVITSAAGRPSRPHVDTLRIDMIPSSSQPRRRSRIIRQNFAMRTTLLHVFDEPSGFMARVEYYHDRTAPQARALLPAAFAVVRNGVGEVLLVRRTDDGYWELPGGRVEVGESASAAVVREVTEEAGVAITVTGLSGLYTDPDHVLAYPPEGQIYQQFAVCFHAFAHTGDAQPDHDETSNAMWFDPDDAQRLAMHPAMRQRLTNALAEPNRAHYD